MKKYLARNVIYVGTNMNNIDTNQPKFYPFLNSSMLASSAKQEIAVKGIHAMANWNNIQSIVPHQR